MNNKQVLAKVGDREITREDIEYLLKNIDPQTAAQFSTQDGVRQLISQLANQELFYLDAIENGVDKESGYTEEVEKLKVNVLKQYTINKYLNTATISDNEVQDYYEQNKQDFCEPETVKASHILVKEESEATNILSELENGMNFEDAAREYSTCPSKAQGGDLGFFSKGKMVPEFEKAAFSMNKDEVSKTPVKTQFGYHIIKLTDKKEPCTQPFSQIKDNLKQQLLSRKQEELYFNKIEELKSKYDLKLFV